MEIPVEIKSEDVTLSGLWAANAEDKAVIVCHPHPLYGGDRDNAVVQTTINTYARHGYSTLRFNFRGVGKSTGTYDHGKGEQKDLISAAAWLRAKEISQIHIVGYSFGAWISALTAGNGLNSTDLVLIAPPVAFIKFPEPLSLTALSLVVVGGYDDFAPLPQVESKIMNWNKKASLEIITQTDHFFFNALAELESILTKHITTSRSRSPSTR